MGGESGERGSLDDLRGLIDTNIVILRPALNPADLPAEMVISAITLAELSAGPHHADGPAERARQMSVLQHAEATFEPLAFDTAAARAFDFSGLSDLVTIVPVEHVLHRDDA
jgi:hypothetical protein